MSDRIDVFKFIYNAVTYNVINHNSYSTGSHYPYIYIQKFIKYKIVNI